jgi:hypothetical protein
MADQLDKGVNMLDDALIAFWSMATASEAIGHGPRLFADRSEGR